MKFISLIACVIVILIAGTFAALFLGKDSALNTVISKASVGKEYDQAGEKQNLASDGNSFSVKEVVDNGKSSPNTNQAMIDRGKNYLLTKVGNRIKQLTPFKSRIENMPYLGASEKNSLVSELGDEIAAFESYMSEISRSETKEDIRNVADKIKVVWLKSSETVKHAEENIIALKENQLINDADTASVGIQKRIDVLKASGKETKEHEKLLSEYGKKIAEAKQDVKFANEKYIAVASATSEGEKALLMKDTNLLLKSAKDDIKDAYKLISKGAREDFSNRFK